MCHRWLNVMEVIFRLALFRCLSPRVCHCVLPFWCEAYLIYLKPSWNQSLLLQLDSQLDKLNMFLNTCIKMSWVSGLGAPAAPTRGWDGRYFGAGWTRTTVKPRVPLRKNKFAQAFGADLLGPLNQACVCFVKRCCSSERALWISVPHWSTALKWTPIILCFCQRPATITSPFNVYYPMICVKYFNFRI